MSLIDSSYLDKILYVVGMILILLITWVIYLEVRISQMNQRFKELFAGKKASDLEGVMFEQIKRLRQHDKDIKELFRMSKSAGLMASRSIQKASVIRYNPFGDTGGNQSFAIALLDSNDNGLIISSLYSREGMRVYSKPIKKGKSKYPLSDEEVEAIKIAQQS